MLARKRLQELAQFGVTVETVKRDLRHGEKATNGQSSRVSTRSPQGVKVDTEAGNGLELCNAAIGPTMGATPIKGRIGWALAFSRGSGVPGQEVSMRRRLYWLLPDV